MQKKKLSASQKQSKARGKPQCNHPDYMRERFMGAKTGDYVCTTCGAYVDPEKLKKHSRKARGFARV